MLDLILTAVFGILVLSVILFVYTIYLLYKRDNEVKIYNYQLLTLKLHRVMDLTDVSRVLLAILTMMYIAGKYFAYTDEYIMPLYVLYVVLVIAGVVRFYYYRKLGTLLQGETYIKCNDKLSYVDTTLISAIILVIATYVYIFMN